MGSRFDELLARCRRRKLKRLAKGALPLVLLAAVGAGGYLYLQSPVSWKEESPVAAVSPTSEPVAERVEKTVAVPVKAPHPHPAAKASPAKVSPEKTAAKVRKSSEKPVPAPSAATKKAPAPAPKPRRVATGERPKKAPPKPKRVEKRAPPVVKPAPEPAAKVSPAKPLIRVKEVRDLDALVRQFEKYPKFETALKIATIHFDRAEYDKAAEWARKANRLDRDDERAWILYARSEHALGHEERARRILRLYLDYRNSVRARALLRSWEKGTKEKR